MSRSRAERIALSSVGELSSAPLPGGGVLAALSRPRPGRSGPNEDSLGAWTLPGDGLALLVADGCGGHADGHLASSLAVESFERVLSAARAGEDLRPLVLDAFESANESILSLGRGGATTLVAAWVQDGRVRTAHAGDAAALVLGGRGRVKHATLSHAPVSLAQEAGWLDESDALHHEDRAIVSNVVGDREMRIELGPPIALRPRDRVLLASDGLTDNLTLEEIVDGARRGSASEAAGRLAELAASRMSGGEPGAPSKPDDLSLLLLRPGR